MRLLLILCMAANIGHTFGQMEDLIEETINLQSLYSGDDLAESELTDQWRQEFQHPIQINLITYEELIQLPWVSQLQAQSLIAYRKINGKLIDIYELQAVPGWDLHTIRLIAPLIVLNEAKLNADPRKLKTRVNDLQNSYLMVRFKRRLESADGDSIEAANFRGSPNGVLSRLRIRKPGDFGLGITVEKDPGEVWTWNSKQFGADFWSFHLALENIGNFRKIIIGDFQGQWDQGLIFSSGFSLGRQVIAGVKRASIGLIPYSSVTESGYYRGVAAEYEFKKKLLLSTFISHIKEDAAIREPDRNFPAGGFITSIIRQGLHRNRQELSRKNQVWNTHAGINLRSQIDSGPLVSLSALHQNISLPLIPAKRRYNSFYFSGKSNGNYSLSLEQTLHNSHFFAQGAISANGGKGLVVGVLTSISPQISTALKWRLLEKGFQSIAGGDVGISTRNNNEYGIYLGTEWLINPQWKWSGYLDLYRLPWASFRADQPSEGLESMFRMQYTPKKLNYIDLQWRTRTMQINHPLATTQTNRLLAQKRHQVILKSKWTHHIWTLKSRFQWSGVSQLKKTQGFLASQEIIWDKSWFQFTLNATIFNTDDFDNRQYTYERDLLYSFSFPFYQGTGSRWYVLSKVKISQKLNGWARVSRTIFNKIITNSSTLNPNSLKSQTDLRIQLLYKL